MRYSATLLIGVAMAAASYVAVLPTPLQAQETLFSGEASHGGYGGMAMKVGPIRGELSVLSGARGAWILKLERDHALHLGVAGYGLATRHRLEEQESESDVQHLAFGYGGIEVGYVHRPDRLVHLGASALIGGAGAAPWQSQYSWQNSLGPSIAFVLEPGLNAEVNLTTFARLSVGASYRWVSGLDLGSVTDADLSGINGTLSFHVGLF
jgi:hypothetical protein